MHGTKLAIFRLYPGYILQHVASKCLGFYVMSECTLSNQTYTIYQFDTNLQYRIVFSKYC